MDKRFVKNDGLEAFTGNELVVKGGLEGGVNLLTGYPGSPVADVFEVASNIAPYLKEHGILAQLANNEALAAARLNGSQLEDLRAMAVMKSVGLNVAADGLATGTLAKPIGKGGAVIVVGDDPWSDSTQVPQDSRRLSDHILVPVLEPSTFQELKDWLKTAFELSAEAGLYICYLVTTNQADGGGTVEVKPNLMDRVPLGTHNKVTLDTSKIPVDRTILLPPHTGRLEEEAYKVKFPALLKAARTKGVNRLIPGREKNLGFVTSGLAYCYLEQVLSDFGMAGRFPILKLGLTFPVDPEAVGGLLEQVDTVVVVEEKRRFVETQVLQAASDLYQSGRLAKMPKIWGKTFPESLSGFPAQHGMNPAVVMKRLGPLFEKMGLATPQVEKELAFLQRVESYPVVIPARTPTFCPGCPHRDSSSVFLELVNDFKDPRYMKKEHGSGPMDIVFHGDAGCYSMLFFAPNAPLMHNYSGMGLGGGTGAGISPFTTNKSVAFIGDSTFFHSGMSAISDSLKNKQDICYVVLNNGTTAMTGHQPHPGVDEDIMGESTFAQDAEDVIKGIIRNTDIPVVRINPERRQDYRDALEDMLMQPGPKFVIADKECGITYHRRLRREKGKEIKARGYLPTETRMNVASSVCEYCLECTRLTGCPGLTIEDTLYGPKIQTDLSNCVSDEACARVKACPSFERVTIVRSQKPESPALPNFDDLKVPQPAPLRGDWRAYLCGIGGMGIGSTTAVLVRAGQRHGYHVNFCDKKGLAIRNGGVYSHVTFSSEKKIVSPIIPYGKANLLIGLDLLEAVRGIDPHFNLKIGSPEYTSCVVNTAKTPTILTLCGKDDFQPGELEATLQKHSLSYFGANLSRVSQELMGHTLYVNVMMLGAAFQQGLLPLTLEELESSIRDTFRPEEAQRNLAAFRIGRHAVVHPETYGVEEKASLSQVVEKKAHLLGRRGRGFKEMVAEAFSHLHLDDETKVHFVDRLYELIEFENLAYAKTYMNRVIQTFKKDSSEFAYRATKAVIQYLHKVMAIKDEIYVAHLLTSPEKYEKDRKRYGVDPSRGDRIIYQHLNRPHFDVAGFPVEFDLRTRDWMLRIMKHMKFLRRLMPAWHTNEKAFREWYGQLVDRLAFKDGEQYWLWVKMLELPEKVRGYRQVRYPKMEEARRQAEEWLASMVQARPGVPQPVA